MQVDSRLVIRTENNKQNNERPMCCHSLVDSRAAALKGHVCETNEVYREAEAADYISTITCH